MQFHNNPFKFSSSYYFPMQEWRPTTVSSRICIRNLRDLVDDVRLYKEFQRFGPVQNSEVVKTPDGKSSGTGYVDFKDKSDAARVRLPSYIISSNASFS